MITGDPTRSHHSSRGRAEWLHQIRIAAACAWVSCAAVGAAGNPFGYRFEPLPLEWYNPSVFGYRISSAEDLDHDGDLDVIIAPSNPNGDYVTLLLGQPGGGFDLGKRVFLRPEVPTADPLLGDFTGDGFNDLVVPLRGGLSIWPMVGRPPNTNPINENFGAGNIVGGRPAVLDLDGDRVAEIVLTTVQDKVVVRWSDATFSTIQLPSDGYYEICPVADHDGNGTLDLLVRDTHFPRYMLISHAGERKFDPPREIQTFSLQNEPVDLDANGLTDVLMVLDSQVMWQPDFAAPGKSLPRAIPLDGFYVNAVYGVGQFGGGPEIDLVFHRHVHALREDAVLWIDPVAGGREIYELGSIFNIDYASSFARLDQNGDGQEDMIIVDEGLHIYEPDCERLVKYRTQTVLVPEPALDLHAVDMNGDGSIEIASVRQDDLVLIQSDSLFAEQLSFQQAIIPWGGWMVDSADLDGDGVPELVGTSSTDSALWVYALENGQLVHRHTVVVEPEDALYSFRIQDLDGDGTVEIIVADDAGNARVFDVDASGIPQPHSVVPAGNDITIELMDLNADTLPDLLTGNQVTEEIWIYLNVGDLNFEFERAIPVGVRPYWIVARDIDNDGLMDLVFGRSDLTILWGEPDMQFSAPQVLDSLAVSLYIFSETEPVDLTGDGLLDIPAAIAFEDESAIFWQCTPRQFERIPYSGYDHAAMTSADLDSDGRVELLALSAGNRGLDIVWAPPLPCPADLNNDCTINFFDASDFLTAFGLGQPTADLAEPLGVWDFFDVSAFLAAFTAGCP